MTRGHVARSKARAFAKGCVAHVKPMDNSQDAVTSDSQPPSRATASLVAAIAPSLPTGPVRTESGVRAVQRAEGSNGAAAEDEEVTKVDAPPSSQPLTDGERLLLSDQIHAALEKTFTPVPPVSGVVPAMPVERAPNRPPPRKPAPDHEAFALARAIGSVPPPAPSHAASLQGAGIMLPPPPQPGDMVEPEVPPVAYAAPVRSSSGVASGAVSLGALASDAVALAAPRAAATAPPTGTAAPRAPVQAFVSSSRPTQARPATPEWRPPSLNDMPSLDPFAGFVRPPPSALQRWGMALLIALALFGLCALAAIGFGYLGLGKTSWPPFGW